jgi:hypothetical protein
MPVQGRATALCSDVTRVCDGVRLIAKRCVFSRVRDRPMRSAISLSTSPLACNNYRKLGNWRICSGIRPMFVGSSSLCPAFTRTGRSGFTPKPSGRRSDHGFFGSVSIFIQKRMGSIREPSAYIRLFRPFVGWIGECRPSCVPEAFKKRLQFYPSIALS